MMFIISTGDAALEESNPDDEMDYNERILNPEIMPTMDDDGQWYISWDQIASDPTQVLSLKKAWKTNVENTFKKS